jgi:hypothetical protein
VAHEHEHVLMLSCNDMMANVQKLPNDRVGVGAKRRARKAPRAKRALRKNFGRCAWASCLLSNEMHNPAWRFAPSIFWRRRVSAVTQFPAGARFARRCAGASRHTSGGPVR